MSGLVITYISGILRNINVLALLGLVILTFVLISDLAGIVESEFLECHRADIRKIFFICLVLAAFIPTSLDNRILESYINENAKLRNEVNAMHLLVNKYQLQHELETLENN